MDKMLKIMERLIKFCFSWIALFIMTGSLPVKAAKQNPKDSLPGLIKELALAPVGAAPADRASEREIVLDNRIYLPSSSRPNEKSAIMDLHPMAISFVKDYLDENKVRLEKMKGWGEPYFRTIDQIFTQYKIPRELKYLAVIESNLKSAAVSGKGAVGPWQIMPETGRNLGLTISETRDDRMDLNKSTHAAAKYLRELYRQMGDWLLVIAAYNGGPGRVESAIRRSNSRDFWKLQYNLPLESRNHVKKFIATHYIMEGQGGVTTGSPVRKTEQVADSSLLASTTTQAITGKYHSLVIAKNLAMDIFAFNLLNPGFDLKVGITEFALRLPFDKMELFNSMKMQILAESVQFLLNSGQEQKEKYPESIRIPEVKKTSVRSSSR